MDEKITAYKNMAMDLAVQYSGKLVLFFILLFITFKVSNWGRSLVKKISDKREFDPALSQFFANITKYIILIIGVVTCLGTVGVQTAGFAAILASAGFAVGLALQGTLSHFASGVMILIFRPFDIGDVITVGGTTGKVVAIDLFSTSLDTPDNRRIILPNGSVYGQQIENVTYHDIRRVDVVVGTAYEADTDETRTVLMSAIKSDSRVLMDPEPAVALTGLGASSVDWALRAWVKKEDYWDVMDSITRAAKYELDKRDIGIPYPQMELNFPQSQSLFAKESAQTDSQTVN